MHVKGVEIEEIRKGMMICGLQFRCHVSQCFEAEITVINPPENKVVSTGFCGIIHLHTIQEEVRISKILTNTTSNQKGGMIVLKQGQTGTCIIESDVPLCVEKFSEFPEIARFSIRAESR
jgi:peptide chain release factor subunit 3